MDVDQSEMLDEKYGEGITVTSAMKSLEATVNAVLDAIQNDRWEEYGGHFMSLGLISGDDPSVNFTQLAETTQWDDGFTRDDYLQLVNDIYTGKIEVSGDTSSPQPSADHLKLNFLGNLK